jgi:hypothetical protein
MAMKLTRWTDRRLRRLFERYNVKFWAGKLPAVKLVAADYSSDGGELGAYFPRALRIVIHAEKCGTDRKVRDTLLHEMCHVAVGRKAGHGPKFNDELIRLYLKGAPLIMHQGSPGDRGSGYYETQTGGQICPKNAPVSCGNQNRFSRKCRNQNPPNLYAAPGPVLKSGLVVL